jgi:hypothetical protein
MSSDAHRIILISTQCKDFAISLLDVKSGTTIVSASTMIVVTALSAVF